MSVPYLDMARADFSVRSPEVMTARESSWYAETPFGIAVLRYEDANALLKERRLFQGTRKWPSHFDITDGILAQWWPTMLLSIEGTDHLRLRKLAGPAFSPKVIELMTGWFAELAESLIDNFYERGECEFMSEFAEAYSAM